MPTPDGFRLGFEQSSECATVADGLHLVLDGAADSLVTQRVEAHLRTCPNCAREMDRLRRLVEDLRRVATAEPPPALWDRVHAQAGPAGRPELPTSERPAGAGGGLLGWIARLLLRLYDGDLARRVAQTGTCRDTGNERHGLIALSGAAVGCMFSLPTGWVLLGVPLLWLASTRLESRWPSWKVVTLVALSSLPVIGEMIRLAANLPPVPLALPSALTGLAVAQALATPRLRPEIFGLLRVPTWARAGSVIAGSLALARPDLIGAGALVPLAVGAGAALLVDRVTSGSRVA